ncbi:hypothetical protein ACFLS5_04910 [Candidatus Bipolaricaulota bacterium]
MSVEDVVSCTVAFVEQIVPLPNCIAAAIEFPRHQRLAVLPSLAMTFGEVYDRASRDEQSDQAVLVREYSLMELATFLGHYY